MCQGEPRRGREVLPQSSLATAFMLAMMSGFFLIAWNNHSFATEKLSTRLLYSVPESTNKSNTKETIFCRASVGIINE